LSARASPAALVVAALAGALFSLTFAHPAAWPLQFACVATLAALVLRGASPGAAALRGLAFGTAWIACSTWWMFISMHRYGGLAAPLAAAAVLLLALVLSGYLALGCAAAARWRRDGAPVGDALLFAAAWCAAELARGLLFTGFPWAASGYGQVDGPLAGLAPWIGVYGIGFVIAFASALVASLRWRPIALAVLLVAVAPLASREFTHSAGRLSVSLLQTNVPQEEKFDPQRLPQALAALHAALRDAPGDFVLGPETAIPLLPAQLGDDAWAQFRAPFGDGRRAALVGLPLGDFEAGYTNSVTSLGPGSYRYDKHHLVPFGEFIPPGFRWFTALMNIPLGDFARGPLAAPSFAWRGQRIAPNICYEDLFGEELAARFADAARAPTVLANVSNIAWFGDTIAIDQHLHISRLRTLELQRPMLRATNTGATAVIDHRGRVTAALPRYTRGVLNADVEGRDGLTPYAAWAARFGLWPLVAAVAGLLAAAALRRR
jgi:apolipoprotein N-acyltransferase